MKKIFMFIAFFVLSFCLLVKMVPNIATLVEIKKYERIENKYSETPDDILLTQLVYDAADKQYYHKLQQYGEIFFEKRDSYAVCEFLNNDTYNNENYPENGFFSKEELYDVLLWQYLITYFYDFETNSLTYITSFLERYDKLRNNFIGSYEEGYEKFCNGLLCTNFFVESDLLKERFINALNIYWLLYDETHAYDIVIFSAMECNSSELNDLYMDIISFESENNLWRIQKNTITEKLEYADVCEHAFGVIDNKSHIVQVAEYFNANLSVSKIKKNDIFVFYSKQNAYVFFGEKPNIFLCYNLNTGELMKFREQSKNSSVMDTEQSFD